MKNLSRERGKETVGLVTAIKMRPAFDVAGARAGDAGVAATHFYIQNCTSARAGQGHPRDVIM